MEKDAGYGPWDSVLMENIAEKKSVKEKITQQIQGARAFMLPDEVFWPF